MEDLKKIREKITEIDNQMAQLFEARMRQVAKVAEYKRQKGLPIYDPKRENEVHAKGGARVVGMARRGARLEELAGQIESDGLPGKVLPYVGDVCSREVNEGMIDFAVEKCGKLDVLVNNAGIMDGFEAIGDISDERWDQVFAVNVKGPMFAMRKAVQVMLGQKTRGNIVNVASIGGTNGARAGAAYTASKHALVGMTENTGYMYAHEGIRCNAICPSTVVTPMTTGSSVQDIDPDMIGAMGRHMDLKIHPCMPDDVAKIMIFPISDDSRALTGQALVADFGATL